MFPICVSYSMLSPVVSYYIFTPLDDERRVEQKDQHFLR